MPKKTRLQKKRADLRRQVFITPPRIPDTVVIEKETLPQQAVQPVKKSYEFSEYEILLKASTISDLKKTLLITTALFALEFFVFYAKLRGILN